jgi:hypothetical protein
MSQGPRTLHSRSKKPSGLADTLMSLTAGPSNLPPRISPSNSADYVLPPRIVREEDDQEENFVPTDCGDANSENPDDPGDSDPDNEAPEPDAAAPPLDQSLAQSLALLAAKIGTFSQPSKPRTTIQQRAPDDFDGTDLSKLDTFIFQCGLWRPALAISPDKETRVSFSPYPTLEAFHSTGSKEKSPES